jgi:hypothetical protein
MRQSHESSAHGEGFSQCFSSSSTDDTSWTVSSATDEKPQDNVHKHHNKHIARLSLDLLLFKEHLHDAIEHLTVPQFLEIRRQFEAIWSEVLNEL